MSKKVKGFKEFMKTPKQIPAPPGGHPVPPGYKRVPDHIAGWKLVKVNESVGGAVLGGIAGGLTGGPIGAAVGAYAGHKIFQKASKNQSFLDAAIANKASDILDKRRAKKAVAAGQTRFRPGVVSRYLRNLAVRKSGGMYSVSPDATEPVSGLVKQKPSNVVPLRPKKTPQEVQQTAAPAQPVTSVNPTHVNHPAHGIFAQRSDETETGQELATKRKARQATVAAAIRAAEKKKKTSVSANFDLPGARQKKEPKATSSTILVPEEKGK